MHLLHSILAMMFSIWEVLKAGRYTLVFIALKFCVAVFLDLQNTECVYIPAFVFRFN